MVAGGRFDSVDGSYAYLYAAVREQGAYAETFARDLDYTAAGPRPLPRARVAGKSISVIRLLRTVRLVYVQAEGAEQVGQDAWLTTCDEGGYPTCREWARAIRGWVQDSDGLTWRSRRDPQEQVVVLWGAVDEAVVGCGLIDPHPASTEGLEVGDARSRLERWLAGWRLYLEPA